MAKNKDKEEKRFDDLFVKDPRKICQLEIMAEEASEIIQVINVMLAEDLAKVIQAKSKIMRFGLHDYHPKNKVPNQQKLGMEIGNMWHMVKLLVESGIIEKADIEKGMKQKKRKLKKWFCFFN